MTKMRIHRTGLARATVSGGLLLAEEDKQGCLAGKF